MRPHQASHQHRMEEADMAPPHKRRRLADTSPQLSASYSQLTIAEPLPTFSHTVEQLEHRPTLARIPRPVPQRIEEVHFQIQKRRIPDHHEHYYHQALQRRQWTAVSSALDSTLTVTVLQWADATGGTALSTINDDLGGTYGTTQTLTLVSSPLPSATSAPSSTEATVTGSSGGTPSGTPSEGFIGNSPSATSVSSPRGSGAGSATSTGPSSAGVTAANITGSSRVNSTRTGSTLSQDSTRSSDPSRASLGLGVFRATVSNGDVVTFTRSDEPYATTVSDGRVSTIAPSSSRNSDRSSQTSTRTSFPDSSDTIRSTPQQSTQTSIDFVTEPNQTQDAPATPATASISSTSSTSGGGGGSGTTVPSGTIAGGVVGGCAGLAVILLVALILLRWWKRKAQNGHHALPPFAEYTPDPDNNLSPSLRVQPGMAERAGLRPLVGAVPAFFRHSGRLSAPSDAPPSERGFTRVSGRKMPSQFSPGMMAGPGSPPPSMPLGAPGATTPDAEHERNLSSHSFYRDSEGFYGGEGYNVNSHDSYADGGPSTGVQDFTGHSPSPSESLDNPTAARGPTPEEIALSPGPQRTPTVHRGGPYTMSPSSTVPSTPGMPLTPMSPAAPSSGVGGSPFGGGQRSETPNSSVAGGDRSSRFTEEV